MRRERQDGKNDCKCVRYGCINGILCRWYRNFGENDTSWSHKPAQQKCRHLSKKQEQINDSCILVRVNILGKPMTPRAPHSMEQIHEIQRTFARAKSPPCRKIGSRMHASFLLFVGAAGTFTKIDATFRFHGFLVHSRHIRKPPIATNIHMHEKRYGNNDQGPTTSRNSHLINLSNCPQNAGQAAQTLRAKARRFENQLKSITEITIDLISNRDTD